MRFLFVDAISSLSDREIVGEKTFPIAEPMQYQEAGFGPQVAPGVICEAMGQLVSWLCIQRKDFAVRPVFLFAERIENLATLRPGERVELRATLNDFANESCRFSAEARVEGELVQTLDNCVMSFVPLDQLEDPEVTRTRFAALTQGGIQYADAEGAAFPFRSLIDEVKELTVGELVLTQKRFSENEPFYADHFPRFPVTPVVILNEMIGQASRTLFGRESMAQVRLRRISDCKIRSFVRPGETCETRVRQISKETLGGRSIVTTEAEILKEKKRILRATWQFETLEE